MSPTSLLAADIDRRLEDYPHWKFADGAIERTLKFANFVDAFGFMARVALVAERMNHHPEWSNVYATVVIRLRTHDCDGVSKLDFELASAVDAFAS